MQELIIKSTLPTIEGNFEVVKQQLIDGLEQYNVIITADTIKDGKAMASELNKIKKAIKDQETKALEDILEPIDGFKEKIKELLNLADEAREKITIQVKAYEDKTKEEILDKIREYSLNEISEKKLRPPFNNIETSDLAKLSAVTKTGNLTSATIQTIKGRIAEQLNYQLQDDERIREVQIAKEREIEAIREEERIKAETKARLDAEARASTPPEAFQQAPIPQEPEYVNTETGEFYQPPVDHYPNGDLNPPKETISVSGTKVKVLIDFEVDISKIPGITDQQLINALMKKLSMAGINNAQVRDLLRI